jgi:hypothetical protein
MLQISESIPVHVNFVGGVKMALVKVLLQVLQFLTVIIIPAVLPTDVFIFQTLTVLHA